MLNQRKNACQTILRIPMLQGSVNHLFHSPRLHFYEISQEVETKPENAEELASEVDEIDDLFSRVQIERTTSFGQLCCKWAIVAMTRLMT